MRRFAIAAATMMFSLPTVSQAENPVVVELFTSQGCSSCPPADRLLAQLVTHDYVIALALHVDYWDYLGWKDPFASPAFSARQRRYARVWHERSVYTPQMVVQGTQYMVGSRSDEVQRQIMQYEDSPETVILTAAYSNGSATVALAPIGSDVGEASVYLVGYSDGETVVIERGENSGKTIRYVNVVESWETISNWDGGSEITVQADNLDDLNYVVIVQQAGQGRILAATQLTP